MLQAYAIASGRLTLVASEADALGAAFWIDVHEPNAQEQAVLEQALGIKLRLPNFKHMPELGWAWGYAWALALMAVSALLTYVIVSVRTALTAPCFAVPIHIECSAARGYRGSPGRG